MTKHQIDENDLTHLIISNIASGQEMFKQIGENLYEKVAESMIYIDHRIGDTYEVIQRKQSRAKE